MSYIRSTLSVSAIIVDIALYRWKYEDAERVGAGNLLRAKRHRRKQCVGAGADCCGAACRWCNVKKLSQIPIIRVLTIKWRNFLENNVIILQKLSWAICFRPISIIRRHFEWIFDKLCLEIIVRGRKNQICDNFTAAALTTPPGSARHAPNPGSAKILSGTCLFF